MPSAETPTSDYCRCRAGEAWPNAGSRSAHIDGFCPGGCRGSASAWTEQAASGATCTCSCAGRSGEGDAYRACTRKATAASSGPGSGCSQSGHSSAGSGGSGEGNRNASVDDTCSRKSNSKHSCDARCALALRSEDGSSSTSDAGQCWRRGDRQTEARQVSLGITTHLDKHHHQTSYIHRKAK